MLKIVDAVAAMATKYNATPSQIAIAWLVAQGDDIIPIPGTTKVKVRYQSSDLILLLDSQSNINSVSAR